MLKWIITTIFINSSPFAFLIINVKILFNFQKEWCTFGRKKKKFEKNKDYPFLRFKCFEHAAEYLEMTESFGENNLVSRTEGFLSEVILQNLADSIAVLHNCENLLLWQKIF